MQAMREGLRRLNDLVVLVLSIICVALLVFIVLVVAANVFARDLLGTSVSWAGEASVLALLWLVFLGAAIGYRAGMFPAFTALLAALPDRVGRGGQYLILAVNLVAFGFLVYIGWRFASSAMSQRTPILGLTLGRMYLAIPISAVALMLMTVEQAFAPAPPRTAAGSGDGTDPGTGGLR